MRVKKEQFTSSAEEGIKKLLILEDFDSIRAFLSRHFIKRGFDVYSSATLRDAVALAAESVPAVVIIDFDLSDTDAFFALEQLRLVSPQSCLILMGCPDSPSATERALRAGANKLLQKSYDLERLDALVEELLYGANQPSTNEADANQASAKNPGTAEAFKKEVE